MGTTKASIRQESRDIEENGKTIRGDERNSVKAASNQLSTEGGEADKGMSNNEKDESKDEEDEEDVTANEANISDS